MKDTDLDRKIASNWREYLDDMRQIKAMFVWVWQDLTNDLAKNHAKKMILLNLLACAVAICTPYTLSFVFNGLANGLDQQLIMLGLGLFFGVSLLATSITFRSFQHREYVQSESRRQLKLKVTQLFFEKSLGTHIDENNLLNKANIEKGYNRVEMVLNLILFEAIETIALMLFSFIALWVIDWRAGVLATMMIMIYLGWAVYLNQKMLAICLPIDKQWRFLNRYWTERLAKIFRVKLNSQEENELTCLADLFEKVIVPDRQFWLWYKDQAYIRTLISQVVWFCLVGYGTYRVISGEMTLGLLYPLYAWSRQLNDNLWRIGMIEEQLNWNTPAILAMKKALTMPIGLCFATQPIKLSKDQPVRIEFKDVSFAYPAESGFQPKYILRNVNLVIEPGEKIALIGKSGEGKTTIMYLLIRAMDPTEGRILLNGIDLKEYDLASWLDYLGCISQQAEVFDGTIRYNLLYSLPEDQKQQISDQELWQKIQPLQLDFGERLINGLRTVVGYNGIKLSGGQNQRLMIGAAVLKDPRFMIIDEATSSLDPTTERLIQEAFGQVLTKDMGALIITHRLNTVRRICNKFVLLENNGHFRVVEAKSFEELAAMSATFRELAKDAGIIL